MNQGGLVTVTVPEEDGLALSSQKVSRLTLILLFHSDAMVMMLAIHKRPAIYNMMTMLKTDTAVIIVDAFILVQYMFHL